MDDYVIAIPSLNRSNEIAKKTLALLKKYKIKPNKIHIFVSNKSQKKLYEDNVDKMLYNKIIIGKKGITNQRIFISNYFSKGQYIVSLDDDVEKVFEMKNEKLREIKSLEKLFKDAYKKIKDSNLFIWGVYPTPNPRFMYDRITTDLRFLIGGVYGYINRKNKKLYPSIKSEGKEDYHQSILYFLNDGGILRFNNIAFKSNANSTGGLGKDRYEINKNASEFLEKKYPKIVSRKTRKNGMPEIRLNNKTRKNTKN